MSETIYDAKLTSYHCDSSRTTGYFCNYFMKSSRLISKHNFWTLYLPIYGNGGWLSIDDFHCWEEINGPVAGITDIMKLQSKLYKKPNKAKPEFVHLTFYSE